MRPRDRPPATIMQTPRPPAGGSPACPAVLQCPSRSSPRMGKGCNPLSSAALKKRRAVAAKRVAEDVSHARWRARYCLNFERRVARAWRMYGGGWPALPPLSSPSDFISIFIPVAGCRASGQVVRCISPQAALPHPTPPPRTQPQSAAGTAGATPTPPCTACPAPPTRKALCGRTSATARTLAQSPALPCLTASMQRGCSSSTPGPILPGGCERGRTASTEPFIFAAGRSTQTPLTPRCITVHGMERARKGPPPLTLHSS